MCNIVTDFYLYSIVYICLINSRLDVTTSVRHHSRTRTLSWCQRVVRISRNRENLTAIESTTTTTTTDLIHYHGVRIVVKSKEEFTVIELTRKTTTTPINSRRNLHTHTHSISRGFSRGLCEYSDFFRDHWLQPQHIGDVRRDYIHFCGLKLGLESSCFNPSQLRPIQELQSFRGTKI